MILCTVRTHMQNLAASFNNITFKLIVRILICFKITSLHTYSLKIIRLNKTGWPAHMFIKISYK